MKHNTEVPDCTEYYMYRQSDTKKKKVQGGQYLKFCFWGEDDKAYFKKPTLMEMIRYHLGFKTPPILFVPSEEELNRVLGKGDKNGKL